MVKGLFTVGFAVLISLAAAPAVAQQQTVQFGTSHAVALRTNGEVFTWGGNVYCQLGRPTGVNYQGVPTIVMRNVKQVAVAITHNFALTTDGKVYGWGGNPSGLLGMGHEWELCEGPEPVTSLADKTVTEIATGYGFAMALTSTGDLYCSGDNDMGQCPAAKGSTNVFLPVPYPELKGNVKAVRTGLFHTLVQTKDRKMYAFGRGRDGQLGPGPMTNGFRAIPELTDVIEFAAGTWHSVAVKADGTAWAWGNNSKSQLCDGTTANKSTLTKVTLPGPAKATQIHAGGLTTVIQTADGALFGCGDNQWGLLGFEKPAIAPQPMPIPVPASRTQLFSMDGSHAAVSADGCAVRLAGVNDGLVIDESDTPSGTERAFKLRDKLTLCGPKPAAPAATLVREYPKGGQSGCWTPYVEEDSSRLPKFQALRQGLLSAEALLKKNAAFMAPPQPSRFRTSLSLGPYDESGARMHIKVVPERKADLTRLWTGACGVIPQVDRIGGAIAQVSIFFNIISKDQFLGAPLGKAPKRTGTVGGFPQYDNLWIFISKDGRVPWIPDTLADKLDVLIKRREDKLADWKRERANAKAPDVAAAQTAYDMLKKTDPAGAENFMKTMRETAAEFARQQQSVWPQRTAALEKQLADAKAYRATFSADELRQPGVPGDPSGQEKRQTDAKIAARRALTPDEQQQIDEWAAEARTYDRQAQTETRGGNAAEATRLRALSAALAQKNRALRAAHLERVEPAMDDLNAQYELINLKPGPAEQAISFKLDPSFPDLKDPMRIQTIAVLMTLDPDPRQVERRAWQQKYIDTFDFAGLAALIR